MNTKDDFLNIINLSVDDANLLIEDGLKLTKQSQWYWRL